MNPPTHLAARLARAANNRTILPGEPTPPLNSVEERFAQVVDGLLMPIRELIVDAHYDMGTRKFTRARQLLEKAIKDLQ